VPPPDDARVAAQVAALRPRLDRIEALERAGRYPDGVAQARAAVADAGALGYAPVEAEAAYLHGSLLRFAGDMPGAEAAMRVALRRAADARDDVLLARAATFLVYVIGAGQSRPDEALSLADFAGATVSRAGGGDVLRAQLANNVGIVLYTLGRFDAALEKFQGALALWQKALGPDHPDVWKAVNNLAAANSRLGRYGESVAFARRGLDSARRIHGPSHPNVAMAYHTLGLDQDLIGDYDAARQSLERALGVGEEVFGAEHAEVAGYLHSLATVMRSLGRLDEAARLSRRSIAMREKLLGPDDPDVATSLSNLGETLVAMGRPADALRAFGRALAIREKSQGADHPDVAGELREIAQLQLGEKRLADAWRLYDRARRIDEAQKSGTVADSYEGLARVRLAQRRHDEAVRLLRRGLAAFESAPGNLVGQGHRLGLLGRIHLAAGRPAEARQAFEQQAAFWDEHDGELPADRAAALLGLGRSQLALRRPRDAAPPLERAIALLAEDRRPFLEERAEARFALAQALWPGSRARALALARAAGDELAAGGRPHAARRRAVRAWLAAHRR
jgi:serine/threonine-protein kinase